MKCLFRRVLLFLPFCCFSYLLSQENPPVEPAPVEMLQAEESPIPEPLQKWKEWVLRNDKNSSAPPKFNDANEKISLWPSSLELDVRNQGADFRVSVRAFGEAWLPLPGNDSFWPQQVLIDGKPVVVIEKDGRPATKLEEGTFEVSGSFAWEQMPQQVTIPPEIGLLSLSVNGASVSVPQRDANGVLWLKRNRAEEEAEREFLEAKVYRVLEDGIPMWLRTEIEISAAGKSREEELGHALPEGWKIATVESRIPSAIDDSGKLRVQVRAGKWTVSIVAFRSDNTETVAFGDGTSPIAEQEIIGFRAKPDFRLVELGDVIQLDVSQTTFPDKWRNLPVYQWDTSKPFQIDEKMRGMGFQKPAGLTVKREFWLDDDGELMTFHDRIQGEAQKVWRLNVSPGQSLGAARMNGEGQLITRDPVTGASGIEVRERKIDLEAVGRISNAGNFPASGWQANVDQCSATLHIPPGWRVFALTGAEWVKGDWLTRWTLLDVFLLLVFAMAVGKLWGWLPAVIAVLGFGLTYHEPDAPRYAWFLLLVPLAILRVGLSGKARTIAEIGKYFAFAILLIILVPFVGKQVQGVVYPQLEPGGFSNRGRMPSLLRSARSVADTASAPRQYRKNVVPQEAKKEIANLKQDLQARIQTGPAVPSWTWRKVNFGWRGPVTESVNVRVMLIPPGLQRVLTILRVVLLILLVALLLDAKRLLPRFLRSKAAAIVAGGGLLFAFSPAATAQDFPSPQLLEELRKELLETPDGFPRAAEIPKVSLNVGENDFRMQAEVHATTRTAVPLPGKLLAWSPISVSIDGKPAQAVLRKDDYLWIVLDAGIHDVQVQGLLPGASEWAWSFLLEPRNVQIDAEGWNVTGVKPNGVPEKQVIFVKQSQDSAAEAAYDRKDFNPALVVERQIELGLVWQVQTTLTRLSSGGKAVALGIPLLPGENVLSSNVTVEGGAVQARLGAGQEAISWTSELPITESLELQADESGKWVEKWELIASPVWNVAFNGLAPVYESGADSLQPVWRPWPGEGTTLSFSRPQAVPGATMTVRAVEHTTAIGSRQRTSKIKVNLQASLGQDFIVDLPAKAEVTSLKTGELPNQNAKDQPVRRDGTKVIVPVKPGEQFFELEWKTLRDVSFREVVDRLEFPVESSNIETTISVPGDRWVIWADGPLRGPAVRLWSIVLLSLIGAFVLGRLSSSPLKGGEWGLLAIGLTQVHPIAVLVVICWFFLVGWRGSDRGAEMKPVWFNIIQILIVLAAIPVLAIFLFALQRGLLGTPQMMVQGNGSSSTVLRWFAQRTDSLLPEAEVISVSIWYYRLLMLAWALWLAVSALRWIRWGWQQFSRRTLWKKNPPKVVTKDPPPLK